MRTNVLLATVEAPFFAAVGGIVLHYGMTEKSLFDICFGAAVIFLSFYWNKINVRDLVYDSVLEEKERYTDE